MAQSTSRLCRTITYVIVGLSGSLALKVDDQKVSNLLASKLLGNGTPTAQDAVRTLDLNHDGRVSFDDVAMFAKEKGLDYASTLSEFAGLDKDQNGQLDAQELGGVLGLASASPPPATPAATEAPPPATPAAAVAAILATPTTPATPATLATAAQGADAPNVAPNVAQVSAVATAPIANGDAPLPSIATAASTLASQDQLAERIGSISSVADGLQISAAKEQEAQTFEEQAAVLRAQSKRLIFEVSQDARAKSAAAAKAKAAELFKELVDTEEKAMITEVKAAAMRAKADAELREVNDIMGVAEVGLKTAR